ncbi:drug resistance translocase [Bordetella ansorpii]|uniref:Drug resistance translocase n=1 Tax=Bordetella ansorpii TaxID=288768 RepID=A0A157RDK9_9BORD|nr:MFS transporter [Bordetella ansorpii]SAI55419.1 drug resistance translocase [Bordetella ansorpii]
MNAISTPAASARALAVYSLTAATFLGASSAPTPLYRVYQDAWHFSSGTLTLVFAIYAFSLLAALLTTGPLSDHLGRRPVIVGSILLDMLALSLFAAADGAAMLLVARALQGLSTGMAISALGAGLLDASRERGPLLNSLSPLFGMGIGALGTSLLVQYAPAPMRLVYLLLIALLAVEALLVLRLPESASRMPGLLASMRPRVRVPPAARAALLRILPVNIALWALGGFYLSLGPTLARSVTQSDNIVVGGWVVFALTMSGFGAIALLRRLPTPRLLMTGSIALAAGLVVTLTGVHRDSAMLFFAGTCLAGTGFGAAFQGALRSVVPLAQPAERAGLMAAFFVLSYLAFSLPALLAGVMVHELGLHLTTDLYGATLIVLAVSTVAASGLGKRASAAG